MGVEVVHVLERLPAVTQDCTVYFLVGTVSRRLGPWKDPLPGRLVRVQVLADERVERLAVAFLAEIDLVHRRPVHVIELETPADTATGLLAHSKA